MEQERANSNKNIITNCQNFNYMDNLIKFLGVIKKPTVLFTVGLYFIIYEYFKWPKQNLYFSGGILISIVLGNFLEKILKKKQEDANHEALMKYYDDKINKRK